MTYKNKNIWLGYLLFWGLVFLINTGPHWGIYSTTRELIETVGLVTGLQILIAWVAIKHLIPISLNNRQNLKFIILLLLVTFVACEIHILVRVLYLEPTYPESYTRFFEINGERTLIERMLSLWTMKYLFFWKFPQHLYPAFILIAHSFYLNQQKLLKISQQKQKAELEALKNQLNPHFIFNTLNNLYALTLQKSDRAPVVIEKLSDILDYVLYRSNDEFVRLESEIQLLESYITLEKIRYGKRIVINLNYTLEAEQKIAPLILLHIVENACKHSAAEEVGVASVDINLHTTKHKITFEVGNSKPDINFETKTGGIGLDNLKKQLNLIYNENYQLDIDDQKDRYQLKLTILTKGIEQ